MLDVFTDHHWLFYVASGILGLLAGSFINVVITRLPKMLEQQWKVTAAQVLEQTPEHFARFNLATPNSCCPQCKTTIRAWQNIPIISFLLLRGRCAHCRRAISWQYPVVELIAGGLAFTVAIIFGLSWAYIWGLGLSLTLLTLAVIDLRTQLLPDTLTLPLLWAGLLASLCHGFVSPDQAIIGAAAGYLILWIIYQLFRLLTGKEGMGYGDFKLLAALGAWLGAPALLMVLLIASISGAVIGGFMLHRHAKTVQCAIPFGPFLAIGGWLTLVAGDTILATYFSLVGL